MCPKAVDYASQCPKGRELSLFAHDGSGASIQRLMCRICHKFTVSSHSLQWLVCSTAGCCAGYAVCDGCVSALHQAPAAASSHEEFSTVGISLEYLRWIQAEIGPSLGQMTTSQFEKNFLRPRTARRRCSVAGELSSHAATAHYAAPATWFISHTWSNAFSDTLQAIIHFFEERGDASSAVLWFDIFSDSQHADAAPAKSPQWYATPPFFQCIVVTFEQVHDDF